MRSPGLRSALWLLFVSTILWAGSTIAGAELPSLATKVEAKLAYYPSHDILQIRVDATKLWKEKGQKVYTALRHSMRDWCRNEETGFLAEIWTKQGRTAEAHMLLIDALKDLLEQSRTATGSDRKLFEEWFQTRRSTFLTSCASGG